MKYFIFHIIILSVVLTGITTNFNNILYAQDSSSNNNTINKNNQEQNAPSHYINISYTYEPSLILNGTDFIDISHNKTLFLNNFTIAAWIKTNQSGLLDPAHIVNKGGFNTDKRGKNMNYGIWLSKNGTIQGGFETESGENYEVNSTIKYNDGKWHFILLSYDGTLLRLYIDEEKQISTTNTNGAIPDTTGDQPLRIGANSLEEDKFFTGYVDEVRIWNRGLTDSEITQIYSNDTFDIIGQVIYQDFKDSSMIISPVDTSKTTITDTTFNIAISSDWGCGKNAQETAENIQSMNPEIVIAGGDLSYEESADCWLEIIKPFMSEMQIAMGDHEYSDTSGGAIGIINEYLKPLNLSKTYYSFDMNNVHITIIDPHIDYSSTSDQYQFIEQDLKTASTNPKIAWIFVVEHTPMYTSPSKHLGDSTIRDIFHPLFDKYNVDLVFTADNHNYQRTFPLKHNSNTDSSNPIIADRNQTNYIGDYQGQIYIITGTAGRSHYDIQEKAPFVANQDDDQFGFLNIAINENYTSLTGTFYSNGNDDTLGNNNIINNVLDQFTISK